MDDAGKEEVRRDGNKSVVEGLTGPGGGGGSEEEEKSGDENRGGGDDEVDKKCDRGVGFLGGAVSA